MIAASLRRSMRACAVCAASAMLLASALSPAAAQSPRPVTDARLANPEKENWLQYRGNYQGWGYSPLEQITADNVKDLVPVWSLSTGFGEGHEAPPIVNDGVMYVSTPQNQVIAVDAKSGEVRWRYKRKLPEELFQLHPTNRGVGLYGEKLYLAPEERVSIW